ncbi:receptor-like protein kinase HSL1 [Carex littledalei]|uniref:Receptor-like protein kinase HSL1 n=1 Tax=Carex littledalei TaxID=544730 RepID=A0A833R8S3_9POAL|nr:receptor-like protein kinase HSL1 [Carex littledalei]
MRVGKVVKADSVIRVSLPPGDAMCFFSLLSSSRKLLLLSSLLFYHVYFSSCVNQEGLSLLEAKRGLIDPAKSLADWKEGDPTPCNWTGVSCIGPTVTSLDLTNLSLLGPFPSSLCNLPKLTFLSLSLNYINSSLNESSLQLCQSLTHLDLSQNFLVGLLPDALDELPSLVHLDLSGNDFSGLIPLSFDKFSKIERLSLVGNLLNSIDVHTIGVLN